MKSNLYHFLIITLVVSFAYLTHASIPASFGLLTVTHKRGNDNSQFDKYINIYAQMDCEVVSEINIVWNNEESPEDLGVYLNKQKWKRPVYFYKTPFNSMNWRYKLSNQSKADVFFSIDDDITVDCNELKKGFNVWQKSAIDTIGPIVTYGPRNFQFNKGVGFQYVTYSSQYFSIGLVGLAFISKHFLQLYYGETVQMLQINKYIQEVNNCDDIALNVIVSYYYPELPPIAIKGNLQNISPAIAQATSPTHYTKRHKCLQKFSQIFGINPLRFVPVSSVTTNYSILTKQIVIEKKQYLESNVIKKVDVSTAKADDLIEKQMELLTKANEFIRIKIEQLATEMTNNERQIKLGKQQKEQIIQLSNNFEIQIIIGLSFIIILLLAKFILIKKKSYLYDKIPQNGNKVNQNIE